MKMLLPLLPLLMFARAGLGAAEPEEGRSFHVELKVVSVPERTLATNRFTVTADAMTTSSNGQWSVAGRVSDADALLEELGRDAAQASVLSAPAVVVPGGKEAQVEIMRELAYLAPETNVLYRIHRSWLPGRPPRVEAVRSGLYRQQLLDRAQNPGLAIALTPEPADNGTIRVDLSVRYNLLVNESGLNGAGPMLEPPDIASRQIRTQVRVIPNQWAVLGGMPNVQRERDQAREKILIFLRAREVGPASAP